MEVQVQPRTEVTVSALRCSESSKWSCNEHGPKQDLTTDSREKCPEEDSGPDGTNTAKFAGSKRSRTGTVEGPLYSRRRSILHRFANTLIPVNDPSNKPKHKTLKKIIEYGIKLISTNK